MLSIRMSFLASEHPKPVEQLMKSLTDFIFPRLSGWLLSFWPITGL